jgi:hypothetical protein
MFSTESLRDQQHDPTHECGKPNKSQSKCRIGRNAYVDQTCSAEECDRNQPNAETPLHDTGATLRREIDMKYQASDDTSYHSPSG